MRTLRRPMFRIGGSAGEGITSGLAPRQGYAHEAGHVEQNDWMKRPLSDTGMMTVEEAINLSRQVGSQPRGTNVYDFLTEFGLDIASRPPQGNIISTAAASAKGPYEKFLARKSSADVQGAGSQADMFKMLMEGAIKKDKSYAHRDKASMVRENMDKQYGIYDQLEGLDTEDPNYTGQRDQLLKDLRTLKEQVSSDEFAKAQLQYWSDDQNSRKLNGWIQKELEKKGEEGFCAGAKKDGSDCGLPIVEGTSFCTVHQKVKERKDGKKVQCAEIKYEGTKKEKQCGVMTSAESGYCYYHDQVKN